MAFILNLNFTKNLKKNTYLWNPFDDVLKNKLMDEHKNNEEEEEELCCYWRPRKEEEEAESYFSHWIERMTNLCRWYSKECYLMNNVAAAHNSCSHSKHTMAAYGINHTPLFFSGKLLGKYEN